MEGSLGAGKNRISVMYDESGFRKIKIQEFFHNGTSRDKKREGSIRIHEAEEGHGLSGRNDYWNL